MEITPNQEIKHGKITFEKDKKYEVPDPLGYYFINNGWAVAEGVQSLFDSLPDLEQEHVVEIQNSVLGTSND